MDDSYSLFRGRYRFIALRPRIPLRNWLWCELGHGRASGRTSPPAMRCGGGRGVGSIRRVVGQPRRPVVDRNGRRWDGRRAPKVPEAVEPSDCLRPYLDFAFSISSYDFGTKFLPAFRSRTGTVLNLTSRILRGTW